MTMKSLSAWSRREFLTAISGTGAAMMLNPLSSWAIGDIDPRVAAIVAATYGIDTHNHVDVPLIKEDIPGPDIDLAGEMKRSGLSAICMTFAVDYKKLDPNGEAYDRFLNGLTAMDAELAKNKMKRALNMEDLRKAKKKKQPIVIQSVEGAHWLEGKVERVEVGYKRGLRHLTLLHDSDASVPLGDVYTNEPAFGGLTKFGADVIRECNRLGILVDLAHCDGNTVAMALKVATQPVFISHTGLNTQLGNNPGMAKMMYKRLISKENAKVVADAGGVIGVWTHLADTPLEYVQNIRALVDIVGVDHVCIGTDTKMTPPYHKPGAQSGFGGGPGGEHKGGPDGDHKGGPDSEHKGDPDGDHKSGPDSEHKVGPDGDQNKPKDNGPQKPRVGERTNLAWADQNVGFYYAVVDAMLKTGFNEEEIGKIGGGNFCRVFDAATKK
ncbi:peptidase M19 [[Flexibacter] sp. ATCC 35208]|nr:peptidase M19 [[Flexibacter] sp. ATCC 35208]